MKTRSKALWLLALAAALSTAAAPAALAETILRLEEISIEGKLQKPQATYILQRAQNLDLGASIELEEEKLTPRIMEDIKREVLDPPE